MTNPTPSTQYPSPSRSYATWLRFQHWGKQPPEPADHPAYYPEPPRCTRCGSVTHRANQHRPIAPDDACAGPYDCHTIHPGVDHTAYVREHGVDNGSRDKGGDL